MCVWRNRRWHIQYRCIEDTTHTKCCWYAKCKMSKNFRIALRALPHDLTSCVFCPPWCRCVITSLTDSISIPSLSPFCMSPSLPLGPHPFFNFVTTLAHSTPPWTRLRPGQNSSLSLPSPHLHSHLIHISSYFCPVPVPITAPQMCPYPILRVCVCVLVIGCKITKLKTFLWWHGSSDRLSSPQKCFQFCPFTLQKTH